MIKFIQKNTNKKGFTLVELIIVIAVMAILAAIVIPRMTGLTQSFRENADARSIETLARELELRFQLGEISDSANVSGLVSSQIDDIGTPRTGGTNGFYFTYVASTDTLNVFVGTSATAKTDFDTGTPTEFIEITVTTVNEVQ